MKTKNKIIISAMIALVMLAIYITSVYGYTPLMNADGTCILATTNIEKLLKAGNKVYTFEKDYFEGGIKDDGSPEKVGKSTFYCLQRANKAPDEPMYYLVGNYVKIDGNYATVTYLDGNGKLCESEPKYSLFNGMMAYIFGLEIGHDGNAGGSKYSVAQAAIWYIKEETSWIKDVFGEGSMWAETHPDRLDYLEEHPIENFLADVRVQKILRDAWNYAVSIDKTTSTSNQAIINLTDKTDKSKITITDVGDYYRVGPFQWEFDGTLESITVKGNNGDISTEDVRFVKYSGKTANAVSASQISSGEVFYVDVKYDSGATEITGLKLKSKIANATEKIYTAKMWCLYNADKQEVIYIEYDTTTTGDIYGEKESTYAIPLTTNIEIVKVDSRNNKKALSDVGFIFKAKVYNGNGDLVERYLDSNGKWSIENKENAKIFYTDKNGKIILNEIGTVYNKSVTAIEVSNPNYGYEAGTTIKVQTGQSNTITNKQTKAKLSGYVWLDENAEKITIRNDIYDSESEHGMNGITVYVKDTDGNKIATTTTDELGLYSEIVGGEYQFADLNLDKIQEGKYYVEFEYCGIKYQSVNAKIEQVNGSKAVDTNSRNILDSKFTSVNATGTQNLNINGVNINYNDVSNHDSTLKDCTGCNVNANTNETKYKLYDGFSSETGEIQNVNFGLYRKAQTDYALAQDLYNVRVEVNGFSHIYRYAGVRYSDNGNTLNEESSWNVGVKFKNNKGTYSRAIYESDIKYEDPNNRDNELKVYLTYKVALKNESTYLARINSIVDYSDSRYKMISAGTEIDDNDNITGDLKYSTKTDYNDKYSKYVVDTNVVVEAGETKYVYVQFELNREAILTILNNGETLYNATEINSYTTFKNNDINTPVAVIDKDSVPGNTVIGQIDTYEDDTDSAPSIQLELTDERKLQGTVFVDSTSGELLTGKIRQGNGIFDDGEKTVSGVKVTLHETNNSIPDMITTTDEKGNFEFSGYIPGKYTITYTWGDKEYTVQNYKGTVYDSSRDQSDMYWYKDQVDVRKTDAIDDYQTRLAIDNEMSKITNNTINNQIVDAYNGGNNHANITITSMNSTTPVMAFSVEYETTITDGKIDKVEFITKNVDFGIVERAKQQLDLEKSVKSIKIQNNDQILVEATLDENGKLKGTKNYLTYMGPTQNNGYSNNGFIKAELDNELIQDSTLEVEYEIKFINNSELDYMSENYYKYGIKEGNIITLTPSGVVDYLDKDLAFEQEKNTDWKQITLEDLKSLHAVKVEDTEFINSRMLLYTESTEKVLKPTETISVSLNVSKLLTTSSDLSFNNDVESVTISKPSEDQNHKGSAVRYFSYDEAEEVLVIPSTGENRSYELPIIIGISSLIVLALGVIVIRKFTIGNK